MCGLVVTCRIGGGLSTASVELAVDRLAHRGPDGQAIWLSADGYCAMGFRRLALVGPVEQMQPFHVGDVTAVVNGEIYGHAALRRAMTSRGARFTTDSDCEVAAHGFSESDTAFIGQLNGEFALVIWDAGRRRLVAARDRWGVKPLFYRETADGIQLASEVKALAALGPALQWDRKGLFQHFFASLGPAQTLYADVRQVPPGHVLEWVNGHVVVRAYSKPSPMRHVQLDHDAAVQLMAQLRDSLACAVHDRLQGNGAVGCYFSGGVDSAAIAGFAARQIRPASLTAFTVDFGPDDGDALRATEVAATLGMRHERLHVAERDIADHFATAAYHAETIGFNAIGAVRWILGRQASRLGFKAVLAGDGADELFGGYGFSVMDRLVQLAPGQGREQVRRLLEHGRSRLARELGWEIRLFDVTALPDGAGSATFLLQSWNYQRSGIRELLAPAFLHAAGDANPFEMLLSSMAPVTSDGLRYSMDLWCKTLFVNQILVSERFDMAHGVETRYPYLDDRVAAIANRLPDEWLVDQTREKRFLREAVAPLLPASPIRTQKKAFEAPRGFLRTDGPFRRYLLDVIHGQSARDSSILDQKKLLALADRLPALSRESGERVDAMLTMALSFLELQRRLCIAD